MYSILVHLGDVCCYIPAKLITHGFFFLIFFFAQLTGDINLISVEMASLVSKVFRYTQIFSGIRKDFEGELSVQDRLAETETLVTFSYTMKKYTGDIFQFVKYIELCTVFMNIN